MEWLGDKEIEVAFALREQSPNVYMLTEGVETFAHTPQIFVCRKREISSAFLDGFYYLDSIETKSLSHVNCEISEAMRTWKRKANYIAKIDSQVEFTVKRAVFDSLSEYLYPAWLPDYVFSSFSDQPSAYLILLRVFAIVDELPDELFQKGRQGAAMIYRLYSGIEPVSRSVRAVKPVISNSRFDYIKRELLHSLKVENSFIGCYENDELGRQALEYKAEMRKAFAPKRVFSDSQPIDRAHLNYNEIYRRILEIDPSLHYLIHTVREITPPQWGEADTIVKQVHRGDSSARIRLCEMFMRIVLKNALWMSQTYEVSLDDAIQESGIGLLVAIDKYDGSDQTKFSVYAPWWMRQRMMRELPVRERIVRLPVHFREKVIKIASMVDDHFCESCEKCEPCGELLVEIQKVLGCDAETANFVWLFTQYPMSIESLVEDESKEEVLSDKGSLINHIEEMTDAERLSAVIEKVLSDLKPREREVIEMRFGFTSDGPMTLEEIGASFGVTRERIRQIESKAIKKLKHQSRSSLLRPYL